MDWRIRAVCRDEDPELFHPLTESSVYAAQIAEAKAVCTRCPVVAQCLAEALRKPSVTLGIWGGTTKAERDEIVRRDRIGDRASAADEVAVARGLADAHAARGLPEQDKHAVMHVLHSEGFKAHVIASRVGCGADTVRRVLGVAQ